MNVYEQESLGPAHEAIPAMVPNGARALFADSGYTVTDFIPIYRRRVPVAIDAALKYPLAYQFVIRAVPIAQLA